MGSVTAIAILLAVVRITAVPMRYGGAVDLIRETVLVAGVIALCLCSLIPLVGAVLAERGRHRHLFASFPAVVASATFLWWLLAPSTAGDEIGQLIEIYAGAIFWCIINLSILRWCGFRLKRALPRY